MTGTINSPPAPSITSWRERRGVARGLTAVNTLATTRMPRYVVVARR